MRSPKLQTQAAHGTLARHEGGDFTWRCRKIENVLALGSAISRVGNKETNARPHSQTVLSNCGAASLSIGLHRARNESANERNEYGLGVRDVTRVNDLGALSSSNILHLVFHHLRDVAIPQHVYVLHGRVARIVEDCLYILHQTCLRTTHVPKTYTCNLAKWGEQLQLQCTCTQTQTMPRHAQLYRHL